MRMTVTFLESVVSRSTTSIPEDCGYINIENLIILLSNQSCREAPQVSQRLWARLYTFNENNMCVTPQKYVILCVNETI